MARILITGNRGFFGVRFQRYFGKEHEILGIDKDEVDIVDREAVAAVVKAFRPEIVIHGAAITETAFADKHPDLTRKINVDGAVNVADAAQASGARMLFFSTEQVFNGNREPGPYTEANEPEPNTMYGRTKLEAEQLLRDRIESLWILRFTWMFGLPEYREIVNPNVVWDALQIAITNRPARIPVNEYRGLTWVYHMLDRILGVLELPPDTYHIGSENDLGRYDVFRHVLSEMGLRNRADDLLIPDREKYRDRPRDIRLKTDKLSSLGVSFPTSRDAISECLQAFMLKNVGAD